VVRSLPPVLATGSIDAYAGYEMLECRVPVINVINRKRAAVEACDTENVCYIRIELQKNGKKF
jgi:hypothetical protein